MTAKVTSKQLPIHKLFLENPVTADRHSSDEWNTYCILFHLLLWDCSPLHHHSANFVEYNDYHMKTLVLNSWYYLKNSKQTFDDLLNRHFSRQRIDKLSQLENVLGEDRFLMHCKFITYQCKSNTAKLVPITINIFSDSSRSVKNNYRTFHWRYLLIDHNVFVVALFKGGQLGMPVRAAQCKRHTIHLFRSNMTHAIIRLI